MSSWEKLSFSRAALANQFLYGLFIVGFSSEGQTRYFNEPQEYIVWYHIGSSVIIKSAFLPIGRVGVVER